MKFIINFFRSIIYNNQMYSYADSSFQGIMYKPNIEQTVNLDKKFMKRRKEIFQSLNMRKPHKTKLLDESQLALSNSPQNNKKSAQKLLLPDIYLYSKPKNQEIISIEDSDKLIKEISKNLNFISKKVPVLNFDFSQIFKENTKAVPYESEIYKRELTMMNMIFGDCGMNLKPRDVMVLEGQKSKSQYIIFTSHPKHPQSLCCKSEIIIKHVQFLSPKKLYFAKEKSFQIPLKSFIALSCMSCGHQIMKIRPQQNVRSSIDNNLTNDFQEQKRLIHYSKLISSGRFKKALINDQSVDIMNGRKNPLARSKTRVDKLQDISQSQTIKNPRYTEYDREIRIKSYQESMNMNPKAKNKQLEVLISKRKHNISQVFVKKNV